MKIQLKRSNVLDGGYAKVPSGPQMEYGELAVNYNDTDPCVFIKDSANNVIRLTSKGTPTPGDPSPQPGTLDDRYVMKTGSTMSGALILHTSNPSADLESASKGYVDQQIGDIDIPSETQVGSNPPDSPNQGATWWNTIDGRLYVYYTDADSSQWVPATPESGVDIAPDGGLDTDADGLKIKLKPNGGLQNTADGLCAYAAAGYGVEVGVYGIQLSGDWSNIPLLPA